MKFMSTLIILISFLSTALANDFDADQTLEYIQNLNKTHQAYDFRVDLKKGRNYYYIEGEAAMAITQDPQFRHKALPQLEGMDHYEVGPFHCVTIKYIFDKEILCQVSIHNDKTMSHEAFCRGPICSE